MFLIILGNVLMALGCASFGFLFGMEFGQSLERKDSAAKTQDKEAGA